MREVKPEEDYRGIFIDLDKLFHSDYRVSFNYDKKGRTAYCFSNQTIPT